MDVRVRPMLRRVFLREVGCGVAVAIVTDVAIRNLNQGETVPMLAFVVVVKFQIVKNAVGSAFLPDSANCFSSFFKSHFQAVVSRKSDALPALRLFTILLILFKGAAHQGLVSCKVVEFVDVRFRLTESKIAVDIALEAVGQEGAQVKDVEIFS
jgi:hypothetical protein